MNQTTPKSTNIVPLRNICIVLGVTIVCFLVGGGWQLISDPDELRYACFHNTPTPNKLIGGYVFYFISCGALAAIVGASISITVLVLKRLRRKHKA
jgi:hypothetical protein